MDVRRDRLSGKATSLDETKPVSENNRRDGRADADTDVPIPTRLRQPLVNHIVKFGLLRRHRLHAALDAKIVEIAGRRLGERASRTGVEIMNFLCECYFLASPPSISDVYLSTGLSKSTAIRTLAALEKLNVIEKLPDAEDRRRQLIHFTAPFQAVLEDFAAECMAEFSDLMAVGDGDDRRRTEDALRESEHRFRDFATMSSDWFWESGPDHRYSWFSEGHRAKLGLIADAYLGKTQWEIASDLNEQEKWAAHRADLEARRPFRRFRYLTRIDTGESRVIEVNGIPLFDEGEVFVGYRGTANDVTDRVLGETALRESEARLRRAVIGAPIPIMIHAEDGEVLMISNRWTQITGYAQSEIPTIHHWLSRAYGDEADTAADDIRALFDRELSVKAGEANILTASGEQRIWEFHSSPLGALPSGRRIAISMAIDVTARKIAEEAMIGAKNQADQANISKSRFIQRLSHRLRTPLNTLIGFSQMMVAEQFGPLGAARYHEYMRDINVTGKQMLETLNDVIDLAQLEATGRIDLDERIIATGSIINEACQQFAAAAASAGTTFVTAISPQVPALHADERRLRQALTNLLRNAVGATLAGGDIRVTVDMVREGVAIAITSSGGGDADSALEEAQLPYWQGLDETSSDGREPDLGVPLAKALIELHDGTLEIERADAGGGTIFRVLIPPTRIRQVS